MASGGPGSRGDARGDADPCNLERARRLGQIQLHGSAVREIECIALTGICRQVGLVALAVGEEVHPRRNVPELDLAFEDACRHDGPFGEVVQPIAAVGPMESCACRSTEDVSPESFHAVLGPAGPETVVPAAVDLRVVAGSRVLVDLLQEPQEALPMRLVKIPAVHL